jgi:hypothetical protein
MSLKMELGTRMKEASNCRISYRKKVSSTSTKTDQFFDRKSRAQSLIKYRNCSATILYRDCGSIFSNFFSKTRNYEVQSEMICDVE